MSRPGLEIFASGHQQSQTEYDNETTCMIASPKTAAADFGQPIDGRTQSRSGRIQRALKRSLDVGASSSGLLLLSPLLLLVAVAVRLDSKGSVLFRQQRVGKDFQPFEILKFRTMVENATQIGGKLTVGEDPRITRVGRILRQTKIDELPQLFNVLKGDMSLVGPRPEVPRYVAMFLEDYESILRLQPGITDLASIEFRDESSLLGQADDPEHEYVSRVLPRKIALAKLYAERATLAFDLVLIWRTLIKLFAGSRWRGHGGHA